MTKLIVKQFLRSRFSVPALIVLFVVGIVSLSIGRTFIDNHRKYVREATAYQKDHIARHLTYDGKEMGLLLYYLKFTYVNPISPLAGLSIGQRDINPGIQSVNIRTLEGQKYDADIRNPYLLMIGYFDLSFVIIYLFPLIVILFCYNLVSEEKESGTWSMLKAYSTNTGKYLLQKILVRFSAVIAVLFLLFFLAVVILSIPPDWRLLVFMMNAFLYVTFWFLLCFVGITFSVGSAGSASLLLFIWLLLTLLIPSSMNNFVAAKYPVPEAFKTMVKQRDGYHKKWDMPPDSTMKKFYAEYPEYKTYQWQGTGFNWLWYYAMQHLGDVDARADRDSMITTIRKRIETSRRISYLVPTILIQHSNNDLAQTGLSNHIDFLDSTTAFHARLRHFFYPKVFSSSPVEGVSWDKFTPEFCYVTQKTSFRSIYYFMVVIALLGVFAAFRYRRLV